MDSADLIHESVELSQGLRQMLKRAEIGTFAKLSRLTHQEIRTLLPRLKVRQLANLEWQLKKRNLQFCEDDSIKLDRYINQKKLFNLWQIGVTTYRQLDQLPFETFVEVMGGPQSRLFRNKSAGRAWLEKHGLSSKKCHRLPHLTRETAELLYKSGIKELKDLSKVSDYRLAQILQPNFGRSKLRASPLTRARLTEVKYALWKTGITRPFRPL